MSIQDIYPEGDKWVVRIDLCGPEEFIADTLEAAFELASKRIDMVMLIVLAVTDYLCGGWAA